jgi:hypothetical protein
MALAYNFVLRCATNCLQETLNKVLVFNKMERHLQRKVVSEMYERTVSAGEILIKEGDTGLAAAELYVVKTGKFEVRQAVTYSAAATAAGAVLCHTCRSMGVLVRAGRCAGAVYCESSSRAALCSATRVWHAPSLLCFGQSQ